MKSSIINPAPKKNKAGAKLMVEKRKSAIEKSLFELFVAELKDAYWAEKELMKAIPQMIKSANGEELLKALKEHLEVTKMHIPRLEKVFAAISEKVEAVKCITIDGLITESEQIVNATKEKMVRDAAIISAALKIEHYEIAAYGTLCFFAKTLGEVSSADILHLTLDEEKEANHKLSEIMESMKIGMTEDDNDLFCATA